MSNKKQNSLEWYIEETFKLSVKFERQEISQEEYTLGYSNLLQQAKEMHKEEIVNTWSEATSLDYEIGLLDASYILCQIHNAEQYYKETFGGDNEK